MGGHLFFCHSTKMASTISTSSPAKHGIAPMTISDSLALTATRLPPPLYPPPSPRLSSPNTVLRHTSEAPFIIFRIWGRLNLFVSNAQSRRTFNSLTGSRTCRSLSEWPSSSLNMTLGFPYSINILSPSPHSNSRLKVKLEAQ